MCSILWLYQTQGLFIICASDIEVTENTYGKCSRTVGHRKRKREKNLRFNLVKAYTLGILYFTSYNKYLG